MKELDPKHITALSDYYKNIKNSSKNKTLFLELIKKKEAGDFTQADNETLALLYKTEKSAITARKNAERLQDKLKREKQEIRKFDDGKKILLGGLALSIAKYDKNFAQTLINSLQKVDRDSDKKRAEALIKEIKENSAAMPLSVVEKSQKVTVGNTYFYVDKARYIAPFL